MFHHTSIVPDIDRHPVCDIGGAVPAISLDGLRIQLPKRATAAEQAHWLRTFAGNLEDLAEQVELAAAEAVTA